MMELKSPKTKKKSDHSKLVSWTKILRTPLLILFLFGSSSCDSDNSELNLVSETCLNVTGSHRHRHYHKPMETLSEVLYYRKKLNKEIFNFLMTNVLVDGEMENLVHYNGVTAKETFVGADGSGIRLRQLTDGRHLVQLIYSQNGDLQDCEYLTQGRSARKFLRSVRQELKTALDEKKSSLLEKYSENNEDEKFYRQFHNVTFRTLTEGEKLPPIIAQWLNYDKLKYECLERHEQMRMMVENRNKISELSLTRSRRSLRENFIVPGTLWCGAGQLAERYNELGSSVKEDRCCRAHDNCKMNIGAFKRRFGYINLRPFTISHCRCDRRFRACLKLADTSVSNMVGKVFFNVVQTKCFILKKVKTCNKRSWWGKCLEKRHMRQAFLRDNLPY